MRIEDNVAFIEAQMKMLEVYVDVQQRTIADKEQALSSYHAQIAETRLQIRETKKELLQDERLPSELEIEKKLNLRKRVEFFNRVIEDFKFYVEELKILSNSWASILSRETDMPKDFLSNLDRQKLSFLQNSFIDMLRKFNYQSKSFDAIKIATDTYLPEAQKMVGEQLFYNIKFNSSASDFIRCLWAYYTAINFKTRHPLLLMFDEPKQQDMAIGNFRAFLIELSQFKDQQILVFASFEDSDESFTEVTQGLNFSLNRIEQKLIMPLDQQKNINS